MTISSVTQSAAAIAVGLVNAKGDLIVATADDAVTNLTVGTSSTSGGALPQVLIADSTATSGLRWADDYKLLDVMQAI